MNVQVNQNERLIRPSDPSIRYTGRIDNSNPDAPFLIYVCSQVEFRVTGHVLRVFIENIHSCYENRLGVIINGVESAVLLESGAQVIDLSDRMTDGENHVLLFKRQDCCHALVLHGFAVAEDAELLPLPPFSATARRSISAIISSSYWALEVDLIKFSTALISSSVTKVPCTRTGLEAPTGRNSMSPLPSSFSAPDASRMVRESIWLETAKAIRLGMLALIRPVMTSTLGR